MQRTVHPITPVRSSLKLNSKGLSLPLSSQPQQKCLKKPKCFIRPWRPGSDYISKVPEPEIEIVSSSISRPSKSKSQSRYYPAPKHVNLKDDPDVVVEFVLDSARHFITNSPSIPPGTKVGVNLTFELVKREDQESYRLADSVSER